MNLNYTLFETLPIYLTKENELNKYNLTTIFAVNRI